MSTTLTRLTLSAQARRIAAFVLVALAASGNVSAGPPPAASAPAAAPALSVVGEAPVVIPADKSGATIKLPLSVPQGTTPDGWSLELLAVRLDGLASDELKAQFVVRKEVVTAKGWPMAAIEIPQVGQLRAGRYALLLGLRDVGGKPLSTLSVVLDRPAAQLESVGRIAIDTVLPTPWASRPWSTYPTELKIFQAPESKFARINSISFRDGPFRGAPDALPAGMLGASAQTPVLLGNPLVIALKPEGFALGASSGKLEVRGADLRAMQSIDVDVRTRLYVAWIPIVVGFGLLLGFGLRVALQQRAEVARARNASSEVLTSLARRVEAIPDAKLRSALKAAMAELRAAMNTRKQATIDKAREDAQAALAAANADFEDRTRKSSSRLQLLRASLGIDPPLPAGIAAAMAIASSRIDQAAAQLQARDEIAATKSLDDAEHGFHQRVQEAVAQWTVDTTGETTAVSLASSLLDAPNRRQLDALLEHWKAACAAVTTSGDLAKLQVELTVMRAACLERRALLEWLGAAIGADLQPFDALARSRRTGAQAKALRERTEASTAAAVKAVQESAQSDGATAADALQASIQAAADARRDLVNLASTQAAPKADKKAAFDTALERGLYFDALALLEPDDLKLGKPQDTAAAASATPARVFATSAAVTVVPTPLLIASGPELSLAGVQALEARSAAELARIEALQALIIAVIVLIVSFLWYEERFIGSPTELLGLLFFGFTFDLSSSKLLEFAGQLATKPKP
jgi:hypothetical protein